MLPQSHVAYTLAAYAWLRRRTPALPDADPRLLALAAMGPDLIDKPLAAVYFYRRFKSAVLFAHTLLVHLGLLIVLLRWRPAWWPYGAAFIGHLALDRMWFFPDTFYWPLRGWRFHVWQKRGSEQTDIKRAYWYAFTRRPELWGWELGGVLAGAWWLWQRRAVNNQQPTANDDGCRTGREKTS
ncbi:MAG: metal-dependent hydrolase [Caldilineales bacterium]|nr:metal-dependent hydrolase [Caldilineales bacterium]